MSSIELLSLQLRSLMPEIFINIDLPRSILLMVNRLELGNYLKGLSISLSDIM
jgi:hypothetical protein